MIHTQGTGLFGALGHGPDLKDSIDFKSIHKSETDDREINAKQISASWGHSAGVTEEGDLFVWGRPFDFSNLMTLNKIKAFSYLFARFASKLTSALGTEQDGLYPTPYFVDSVGKVASVHCSAGLTVAISESGDLYSFGQNRWGQCGSGKIILFCWLHIFSYFIISITLNTAIKSFSHLHFLLVQYTPRLLVVLNVALIISTFLLLLALKYCLFNVFQLCSTS